MGTWEYRVDEKVVGDSRWYEIIEVYYEKGKAFGSANAQPTGDSLEDLRKDLELMLKALDKPVLSEEEFGE